MNTPSMQMPDFSQMGQQGIKDIHKAVDGDMHVRPLTHRKQQDNDKSLHKADGMANGNQMKQAFVIGFVKAAVDSGLSEGEAIELLKAAQK